MPLPGFTGLVSDGIAFRAWDRTAGVNGGVMSAKAAGGATSLSVQTAKADVSVASSGTLLLGMSAGERLGYGVSADGRWLVVGAATATVEGASSAGLVRIYERVEDNWTLAHTLASPIAGTGNIFGRSVAVQQTSGGLRVVVGSMYADKFAASDPSITGAGSSYVFEYDGTNWSTFELRPDTRTAGAAFGVAVALDGDRAAISAYAEDGNRGAVYVFERTVIGSTVVWTRTARLSAPGTVQANDFFGDSLSLSGSRLAVSDRRSTSAASDSSNGRVHLFESAGGAWSYVGTPTSTIAGSLRTSHDAVGGSVSLVEDWLIVGSDDNGRTADGVGTVYVLRRESSGSWSTVQTLDPPDAQAGARFGRQVSLKGSLLVIGAAECDATRANQGAAYVYQLIGGTWTFAKKVVLAGGNANDSFGFAAATADGWVFSGAREYDVTMPASLADAGAVLAMRLNHAPVLAGGELWMDRVDANASNSGTSVTDLLTRTWPRSSGTESSVVSIVDSDAAPIQGIAVTSVDRSHGEWQYSTDAGNHWVSFDSVRDSHALLLARTANNRLRFLPEANFGGLVAAGITYRAWDRTEGINGGFGDATNSGGISAFSAETNVISITVTTPPDFSVNGSLAYDRLGETLAADGDWLAVGSSRNGGSSSGRVAIYRRQAGNWELQHEFEAHAAGIAYGSALAVKQTERGVQVVVGVKDFNGSRGAVSLYEFDGTTWVEHGLTPAAENALQPNDRFGAAVAVLDGDRIAVGASGRDGGRGALYLFAKNSEGSWSQTQYWAPTAQASYTGLVSTLDAAGDTLIVGAPGANDTRGGAWSLRIADDGTVVTGSLQALSVAEGTYYDWAGSSVAVSDQWLALGAWGRDVTDMDHGRVYLYRKVGTQWTAAGWLQPTDSRSIAEFGQTLAMTEDTLLVGAPCMDGYLGAVYEYRLVGDVWQFVRKLDDRGGRVGRSIAVADGWVFAGAPTQSSLVTYGGRLLGWTDPAMEVSLPRTSIADLLLQPDGKQLLIGVADAGQDDFVVVERRRSDGSFDESFGRLGKATVSVGIGDSRVFGALLQADRKIVVYGQHFDGATNTGFVLRLSAEGTPDRSFGAAGVAAVTGTTLISDLLLLDDGRFLAADGRTVQYLRADGTPDASFNFPPDSAFHPSLLARQADGRIVAAGLVDTQWTVRRYFGDGTLDPAFGLVGRFTAGAALDELDVRKLLVQADDSVLLVGTVRVAGEVRMTALRLSADGAQDAGYHDGGVATLEFDAGDADVRDALLQDDGKLFIVGSITDAAGPTAGRRGAIVRLTRNGLLDRTFSTSGMRQIDNADHATELTAVRVAANGDLVVAGTSFDAATNGSQSLLHAWAGDDRTTAVFDAVPAARNDALGSVVLRFNREVTGLTLASLHLSRDGGPNLLTTAQSLARIDDRTWALNGLAGLTAVDGRYVLTLSSADDLRSTAFDRPLERPAALQWTKDSVAPTVTLPGFDGPLVEPMNSISIRFSEPVTAPTWHNVDLRRDGVSVSLHGATWTTTDDVTWTLGNLKGITAAPGTYEVVVSRGTTNVVRDAAGNALSQAACSTTWTMAAPSDLAAKERLVLDLFEEVRNTVRFDPYYGFMKGATATEETKTGNAWDQAALLLKKIQDLDSDPPAQIVTGTIEVTKEDLIRWTGTQNDYASFAVLNAAGLVDSTTVQTINQAKTWKPLTNGRVLIKHAWVQVDIDGWKNLDPSWKFSEARNIVVLPDGHTSILQDVDYNRSQYFEEGSYNVDQSKWLASEFYEDDVSQWLEERGRGESLADLTYSGPIIAAHFDAIPVFSHLPATHVVLDTPQTIASESHQVWFEVKQGANSLLSTVSNKLNTSDVALDELFLYYVPTAGGLVVQLWRNSYVLATDTTAVASGSDVSLIIHHVMPASGESDPIPDVEVVHKTGESLGIGLNAGQHSQASLARLQSSVISKSLAAYNASSTAEPSGALLATLLSSTLSYGIAKYFNALNASADSISSLTNARNLHTHIGSGVAKSLTDTTPAFDERVTFPYVPTSMALDVPKGNYNPYSLDSTDACGDPIVASVPEPVARWWTRYRLIGDTASGLENAVVEELTNSDAISTIRGIQEATSLARLSPAPFKQSDGTLDLAALRSTVESTLDYAVTDYEQLIVNELRRGYTIIVPTTLTTIGSGAQQWSGIVYYREKYSTSVVDGVLVQTSASGSIISADGKKTLGGAQRASGSWTDAIAKSFVQTVTVTGDPINVANGAVYHDETDFVLPSIGLPLDFKRHYDSTIETDQGLGGGWTHSYSGRLTFSSRVEQGQTVDVVTWLTADGLSYEFTKSGSTYLTPKSLKGSLTYAGDEFTYREADGLVHKFQKIGSFGRLVEIKDRNEHTLALTYSNTGSSGVLLYVTPDGDASRRLVFGNNGTGITSVADGTGRRWDFNYITVTGSGSSAVGRLFEVLGPATDSGPERTHRRYEYYGGGLLHGLLRAVEEAEGGAFRRTTFTYYANRRGFEVTDPEGNVTRMSYDLYRNVTTFIDENGKPTTYRYSDEGLLLRKTYADRTRDVYEWNAPLFQMTAWVDAANFREVYAYYDQNGRYNLSSITRKFDDQRNYRTNFTYDAQFNDVKTIIVNAQDAHEQKTEYFYDDGGNVTKIVDAEGNVTLFEYEASAAKKGLVKKRTSPRGVSGNTIDETFSVLYTYDNVGQVLTVTQFGLRDAAGTPVVVVSNQYSNDRRGNLLRTTDADGVSVAYAYDLYDRRTREMRDPDATVDGDELVTAYVYSRSGDLLSAVDPAGRKTEFHYDKKHRLVETVFADGSRTRTTFDGANNAVRTTDEMGRTTSFEYDDRNRVAQTTFADGAHQFARYDGTGRVIASIDALGHVTSHQYDGLGKLVRTTNALGQVVEYQNDIYGNASVVVDRRDPARVSYTTTVYDRLNRAVAVRGAEGMFQTFGFDADGNLVESIAYETTGLGYQANGFSAGSVDLATIAESRTRVTTSAYDAAGRLSAVTDAEGNISRTEYTAAGRIRRTIDALGRATTYEYDALGRQTSIQAPHAESAALDGPISTTAYDDAGNVASTTDVLGRVTKYSYDARNRRIRTEIYSDATLATLLGRSSVTYDVVGNVVAATDLQGRTTTTDYDVRNRVVGTTSPDPDGAGPQTPSVVTTEYDAVGNVVRTTDAEGRTTTFRYDDLNRLNYRSLSEEISTSKVVDDGSSAFTGVDTWNLISSDQTANSLGGNSRHSSESNPADEKAAWTLTTLVETPVMVSVSWAPYNDRSTKAVYRIYDGSTSGALLATLRDVDQTQLPGDFTADGISWKRLGQFTSQTGTIVVELSNEDAETYTVTENGVDKTQRKVVIADAVRVDVGTLTQYDARGNVAETIDPLGRVTKYEYDLANRMTKTIAPDPDGPGAGNPLTSPVTQTVYDTLGNVVKTIDPRQTAVGSGNGTMFEYDRLNRLVKQSSVDPDGARPLARSVTTFAYDAAGNLVSRTDAEGHTTRYEYDRLNRKTREVLPDADDGTSDAGRTGRPATTYVYDDAGRLLRMVDALGRTTVYEYDALDRQTRAVAVGFDGQAGAGPATHTVYDSAGRVVAAVDPLGRVMSYGYDDLNRKTRESWADPDGMAGALPAPSKTYEYDAVGNLVTETDVLGRATRYVYDDRNRLVEQSMYAPAAVTQIDDTAASGFTLHAGSGYWGQIAADQLADTVGQGARYAYASTSVATADWTFTGLDRNPAEIALSWSRWSDRSTNALFQVFDGTPGSGMLLAERRFDQSAADYDFETDGTLWTLFGGEFSPSSGTLTVRLSNDSVAPGKVVIADAVRLLDARTQTRYDAVGNVLSTTDAMGRTTTYQYDALNRKTSETTPDPDGAGGNAALTTRYQYDAAGNLLQTIESDGRTTTYGYDAQNRVVSEQGHPAGTNTPYRWTTYDRRGNVVAVTDQLGRTTNYTYDALGRRTRVEEAAAYAGGSTEGWTPLAGDADRPITTTEYDLAGRVVRTTDPLGNSTEFAYDALDRQTALLGADPDGAGPQTRPIDRSVYDAAGNLTASIDALGNVTTYDYDALDRQVRVAGPDPDGAGPQLSEVTLTAYDAAGRVAATTTKVDADSSHDLVTTYTYDRFDRQTVVTDPRGETTRYEYDLAGNRTKLIDAEGNATRWHYDQLDRTTAEIDPLGNTAEFAYDAVGRQRMLTDREGRARRFSYDALDRIVLEEWLDAGGATIRSFQTYYDRAGNVEDRLERDASGAIVSTLHYVRDRRDRLRLQGATSAGGPGYTLFFDYDEADRLTEERETRGGSGVVRAKRLYAYDALGRITSITMPHGYDALGTKVEYAYDAVGRRSGETRSTQAFGDTAWTVVVRAEYAYDDAGRLTHLAYWPGAAGAAGGTLNEYDYAYDRAGRMTGLTSAVDDAALFSYDRSGQLTAADFTGQADETYAYDGTGNRTNGGYVTGPDNRLLDDGTFTYTYDADGNRTARVRKSAAAADDRTVEYAWDHRHRLTSVTFRNNSGTVTKTVAFTYDALDRRIAQTVTSYVGGSPDATTSEFYVHSAGAAVRAVVDALNGAVQRYFHGAGVDEILAEQRLVGATSGWINALLLADHERTVRDVVRLVAGTPTVVNHLRYGAFGEVTSETDATASPRFAYTGQERDRATGLYHYDARYYDPATARFLSRDPLGFAAGDANLVRYAGNDPYGRTDPTGRNSYHVTSGLKAGNVSLSNIAFSGTSAGGGVFRFASDGNTRSPYHPDNVTTNPWTYQQESTWYVQAQVGLNRIHVTPEQSAILANLAGAPSTRTSTSTSSGRWNFDRFMNDAAAYDARQAEQARLANQAAQGTWTHDQGAEIRYRAQLQSDLQQAQFQLRDAQLSYEDTRRHQSVVAGDNAALRSVLSAVQAGRTPTSLVSSPVPLSVGLSPSDLMLLPDAPREYAGHSGTLTVDPRSPRGYRVVVNVAHLGDHPIPRVIPPATFGEYAWNFGQGLASPTGVKAIVNQSTKTAAGLVSLGFWNPDDLWNVTQADLARGYDLATLPARGGAEIVTALAPGKLVQTLGYGRRAQYAVTGWEAAGNLAGAGRGGYDVYRNGVTWQNAAEIGGNLAGFGTNAAAWRGLAQAPTTRSVIQPGAVTEFVEQGGRTLSPEQARFLQQLSERYQTGATTAALKPQNVDISKLIPPSSRPFADPDKLLRHGPFDWNKYTPIIVETEGKSFWLLDGMTRMENARRVGVTSLPAYVYPKR